MKLTYKIGLVILIILFLFCASIQYTTVSNPNPNTEIVISRYNESLEWLKEEPFNKYPIICYNAGPNDNFYKPINMKVVKIENIGKEAYVYLYHIIQNYEKLENITIFLPGSSNSSHKINIVKNQVYEVEKHNNTVFLSSKYKDVRDDLYDFKLDSWCSTSEENSKENTECKLNLASERPYGKWYDKMFGDIKTQHVNYLGILAIKRQHIIQNPIEHYIRLINELKYPNDEVAHYFERSWDAIFYPMIDAIYITE